MSRFVRWRRVLVAFVTLGVAGVSEALACPVCYGEAEGSLIEGAQASVLFMAGLTYTVLIGGVIGAVFIRKQAVKRKNLEPSLYLVEDSGGRVGQRFDTNGDDAAR